MQRQRAPGSHEGKERKRAYNEVRTSGAHAKVEVVSSRKNSSNTLLYRRITLPVHTYPVYIPIRYISIRYIYLSGIYISISGTILVSTVHERNERKRIPGKVLIVMDRIIKVNIRRIVT